VSAKRLCASLSALGDYRANRYNNNVAGER
jgi:hypothetical protein